MSLRFIERGLLALAPLEKEKAHGLPPGKGCLSPGLGGQRRVGMVGSDLPTPAWMNRKLPLTGQAAWNQAFSFFTRAWT